MIDRTAAKIGEIKTAIKVGYKKGTGRVIWASCIDCGKERWVQLRKGAPVFSRCISCNNGHRNIGKIKEQNPNWKGGRIYSGGYVFVRLYPDDFFYSMIEHHGYVKEHRLVMAQHLGRCLQRWEIVHHKNGIKDDNKFENLEPSTQGNHSLGHSKGYRDGYRDGFGDGQASQIEELKQQIRLLEWRLRERLGIGG